MPRHGGAKRSTLVPAVLDGGAHAGATSTPPRRLPRRSDQRSCSVPTSGYDPSSHEALVKTLAALRAEVVLVEQVRYRDVLTGSSTSSNGRVTQALDEFCASTLAVLRRSSDTNVFADARARLRWKNAFSGGWGRGMRL